MLLQCPGTWLDEQNLAIASSAFIYYLGHLKGFFLVVVVIFQALLGNFAF